MRDYLVPALTVLAMGLVVYAFIGDAACNDPPPPLDAGPPPPDAALPLDAYVQDARPPPPPRPDDDSLTLEDVRRLGLVDMPEVWIDRLLAGSADWARDPNTPAPTFVNHRGTRVTFKVRGGRVQGVGAELGEGALSAEVALLGGFVVGYNDRLPLHFEAPDRDTLVKTRGSFDDSQGRRWYYRAQMRREGEPPYGPAVVELAPEPFPGQSAALDPPALPPGVAPPPDLGLPE